MNVKAYAQPSTLKEALRILYESEIDWKIIAGGTDLLLEPEAENKYGETSYGLVDLSDITELRLIKSDKEHVYLGSMVTFSDLCDSSIIGGEAPIMYEMAQQMGSPQIRNRATIGGNVVNASAAADSIPPLLTLDAELELHSLHGIRIVPIDQFLLGPNKTMIQRGEVLTRIIIPKINQDTAWNYIKLGRRKSAAISRISVAAIKRCESGEDILKIAVGAVTPKPVRLREVENYLSEAAWTKETVFHASEIAQTEIATIAGKRQSSQYKFPVLKNLIRRTLNKISNYSGEA